MWDDFATWGCVIRCNVYTQTLADMEISRYICVVSVGSGNRSRLSVSKTESTRWKTVNLNNNIIYQAFTLCINLFLSSIEKWIQVLLICYSNFGVWAGGRLAWILLEKSFRATDLPSNCGRKVSSMQLLGNCINEINLSMTLRGLSKSFYHKNYGNLKNALHHEGMDFKWQKRGTQKPHEPEKIGKLSLPWRVRNQFNGFEIPHKSN